MRLIMIGTDSSALTPNSDFYNRLFSYSLLVDEIHEVLLVSSICENVRDINHNVKIYQVYNSNHFVGIYNLIKTLIRLLNSLIKAHHRNDIVISVQEPFFLGAISLLIAKVFRVKIHVQVHIDFFSKYYKKESLRQRIESIIAPIVLYLADGIRVVSLRIFDYLVNDLKINQDKIKELSVTIDFTKINSNEISNLRTKYSQFTNIILMTSRLVKQKNILLAINAFKAVVDKYDKAGLIIVGKGSEYKHIKEEIDFCGLKENIIMLDWSFNTPSLMRSSDIFLLSSNYEGWAMTAVEASACGIPVVMTDVGCAGEFVKDGMNGIIVPVNDKEKITEALLKLIFDKDLCIKMGENGRERAKSLINNKEYSIEIIKDFSRLINK